MSLEQFNLKWHTYSDHLKDMMETLMNSHKLADITLVCNDKTKFKAHKFVLSTCSPVFQSILDDLPNKGDAFIYLSGIRSQEMKSILQFMYLGQTTLCQDRMNMFLHAAKNLEIKEIGKDIECDDVDKRDQEKYENYQIDKEMCIKDSNIETNSCLLKILRNYNIQNDSFNIYK